MGTHPDDTWCQKDERSDGVSSYLNWLEDAAMLPREVPFARIMRYGYHSRWVGEEAIRQKASSISQQLLLDLRRKRQVESTLIRPTMGFQGLPSDLLTIIAVALS